MHAKKIARRQAIPILYTRGTHYDVGFDMGRTFGAIIKSFLELCEPLNTTYLPLYDKPEGKNVYNETLESVKKSFPQYIQELEGVADGAQVEFHKGQVTTLIQRKLYNEYLLNHLIYILTETGDFILAKIDWEDFVYVLLHSLFLLHMDDITPIAIDQANLVPSAPVGCSTIIVNNDDCRVLAHTEDALSAQLNHFYFVVADIISDTPQGKYNVKEEKFMSLCYAGHLPGYTMNFNHHGLVFSINTLSASNLRSGKTPRHFITRALLSANNYEQAERILRDSGVGAADGCSINLTFLNKNEPFNFYNIEMGPAEKDATESVLDIKTIKKNEHNFHCNSYLRLPVKQVGGAIVDSSVSRMDTFCSNEAPKSKEDVVKLLGDQTNPPHTVFRENGDIDEHVKTIAVGVFDCINLTYSLYSDNPVKNKPLAIIPLKL